MNVISRPWSRDSSAHEFILPRSRSRSRDSMAKVSVLVSRLDGQGLGLGLETWWPRSRSWSRDLSPRSRSWFLASTNLLYLVSRPRIGLGLETACLVSTPVARSLAQTLSICHLWLPIVVISRPWSRDSSALEFSLSRSRSWDLMVKVLVLVSRPKQFLTTTVGEFLVVTVTMHFFVFI